MIIIWRCWAAISAQSLPGHAFRKGDSGLSTFLAPDDSHYRLLLACLSPAISLADPRRRQQLVETTAEDWLIILKLAERQQVAPLLAARLAELLPNLPQAAQARLQAIRRISLLERQRIQFSLSLRLLALSEHNIPVVVLKGAYLAEAVYSDPAMRLMSDLDLLVQADDLERALAVLSEQGYTPLYTFKLDELRLALHSLPPLGKAGAYTIDLHWTLAPPTSPFHIPLAELWQRSQAVNLAGKPTRTLAPVDLLQHLCLHFAYLEYFSNGLRPLCDIAWTVQSFGDGLDWELLVIQSQAWRAQRCSWLALETAVRLLGAPVPAEILDTLQPSNAQVVHIDWAIAQVLNPSEIGGKLAAVWAPNPWHTRLWMFVRQLFPAPYEMRQAYPQLAHGLRWPLAYARHLVVVVKRNWRAAWRLARGDPQARQEAEQRARVNELVKWVGGK